MKKNFYEQLFQLKYDNEMCREVDCTEEENQKYLLMLKQKQQLPFDVVRCEADDGTPLDKFYRVVPLDITHEEVQEYCALKQTQHLHTIKKCMMFFTILTSISLGVTSILFLISILGLLK